jgi:hypothetical protein
LLHFFIIFTRKSTNKEIKIKCQQHCVFPNLNVELKRINKITLSKSNLSKYLVSGKKENNNIKYIEHSGLLALSSKHRLITLTSDENSKKEILFGIWINLLEEKINKHLINEEALDSIINKYKIIIWEKCVKFIIHSKKIEMINSPSPDEGAFLLVIFFS